MKRALKTLCLLLALALCLSAINAALTPKDILANLSIRVLPQLRRDTVDVCVLGSSHLYLSVNPAYLWQQAGIPAYVLCSSSQNYLTAYYYLQELLKTQTPKVVVLDLYSATLNTCASDTYRFTFSMPLSLNKLRYWDEYTRGMADRFELLLQLPWYHARLDDLSATDFTRIRPDDPTLAASTGYIYNDRTIAPLQGYAPDAQAADSAAPDQAVEGWLTRIAALCKAKGIRLVGLEVPYLACTKETQAIMNGAMDTLKRLGAETVNLFDALPRADWPPAEFYFDDHHMNYRGAEAVTGWLARYLQTGFSLPDRRGDGRYGRWELALAHYARMRLNTQISAMTDLKAMLAAMQPDQTLAVTIPWQPDGSNATYQKMLAATGLAAPVTPCTLVFTGGKFDYRIAPEDRSAVIELSGLRYAIRGDDITLDGKSILPATESLSFTLLDGLLQTAPLSLLPS